MQRILAGIQILPSVFLGCMFAAGCAHSKPDSGDRSQVGATAPSQRESFATGELILESFDRVRPDTQGMAATARMYEGFPSSAGVRVIEQTADRVVVDYDFVALQATRGLPHDDRPIPTRAIYEVVSQNGQAYVHSRMYYTGSEPGVAEQWRKSYRNGPAAAMVPLK